MFKKVPIFENKNSKKVPVFEEKMIKKNQKKF